MPDNSYAENTPEATPQTSNGHQPPLRRRVKDATRSPNGSDSATGSSSDSNDSSHTPNGSPEMLKNENPTNEFTFGWDDLETCDMEISDLGPSEDSDLSNIDLSFSEEPMAVPPPLSATSHVNA